MATFAVLLEDDPDRAREVRQRVMPEHLAFLDRHADLVRFAGPLRDARTGQPAGGLWMVRADDHAAVQAMIEADPFWAAGLRRSVRVLEWHQVFADGRRA